LNRLNQIARGLGDLGDAEGALEGASIGTKEITATHNRGFHPTNADVKLPPLQW
jgi:hypothetical protein